MCSFKVLKRIWGVGASFASMQEHVFWSRKNRQLQNNTDHMSPWGDNAAAMPLSSENNLQLTHILSCDISDQAPAAAVAKLEACLMQCPYRISSDPMV